MSIAAPVPGGGAPSPGGKARDRAARHPAGRRLARTRPQRAGPKDPVTARGPRSSAYPALPPPANAGRRPTPDTGFGGSSRSRTRSFGPKA